jgi:ADP-ribose pyrophosphatase YjhB (NUDIX family)
MSSVGTPDPNSGWLSDEELAETRRRLPLLYVEAVPVRVDGLGQVTKVGILLRANAAGAITRTLVSGRVMYGESLRTALFRHLEKDLGPMAFPLLPASPVPFSVAEYFPFPGSQFTDDRQHAVSLAYVVPVTGTCDPRQDARTHLDDALRGRIGYRVRRDGGWPWLPRTGGARVARRALLTVRRSD